MSGFVKAVAQIYPDKKIASVKHKSVMKRFNAVSYTHLDVYKRQK